MAPAPSTLVVLYEDGDVLAVAKPAGVNVAQENETELVPALQTRAAEYLAEKNEGSALIGPRARLVHRIDRDTSGVVLFAKTPRAQSKLTRDWEAGNVVKTYLAIVRGVPEMTAGMISSPIGRDRAKRNLRAVDGLEPQEARTKFRVLERLAGGAWSLIEASPLTGRTHQIRVHLASIGAPLAIDPLYGAPGHVARPPEISRLTLHASTLEFPAPGDGKTRRAEAPLPDDFRRSLEALRKMTKGAPVPDLPPETPRPRQRRRKV